MIKTEDRLSRNLDDEDFTDSMNDEVGRLGASKITEEMVIAIDPGDLRKRYTKKMEFLGRARDCSGNEIGERYSLCIAVAMDIESKQVLLFYCETYSSCAEDFEGKNAQILKLIDAIYKHVGDRGIHAHYRGGDRGVIYEKYLRGEKPQRFVIRLRERDLVHQGRGETVVIWLGWFRPLMRRF